MVHQYFNCTTFNDRFSIMPSDREESFHPSDIWQQLQRRFFLNADNQGYGINFNIEYLNKRHG